MKDRYIHYKKAGDQFCGRSVTRISSFCKEFAVSPAYFELGGAPPEIENEVNRRIRIFVNGASQGTLYLLVRFFFPSICFHYDDLKRNLSETNRVRASTMFSSLCKEFAVSPAYFDLGSATPEIENDINRRIKIFVNGVSQGPLYFLVRFFVRFHLLSLRRSKKKSE